MMHYLIFDGKPSADYSLYIMGPPTYDSPARDMEAISIPGRNGTLLVDNGRFENIEVSYTAVLKKQFYENVIEINKWLGGVTGYARLEDSYNLDFYRMGRLSGGISWDTYLLVKQGKASLTFDCKPQKFYKNGEFSIAVSSGAVLINPSVFAALPLIRVYGTGGILYVGNYQVKISSINEYVDIDCDLQDCYKETMNCNKNVYIPEFPKLGAGRTGIAFEGNISKVEVTPRWWTL